MSRDGKGWLWLKPAGKPHAIEVRPKDECDRVLLELHRDDCQPGPVVRLAIDEARTLLRTLQSAIDRAARVAYVETKAAQAESRALEELARDLDRVADAAEEG